MRLRNFTVAISQPWTGGRRIRASSREATRPAVTPTFSAIRSLRSMSANTTMAATSPAMPTRAAVSRPALALPWRATRARASTGMASLAKAFQTPETSTAMVVREREKPQPPSIA